MAKDNPLIEYRLYKEWQAFHVANPQIYWLVCKFADEVINAGHKKYAIDSIWGRMRWHLDIETRTAHNFKFPNNHRAYYARLWLDEHPDYPKFFRTCALRSQGEGGHRDRFGVHDNDERHKDYYGLFGWLDRGPI